MPSRMTFHAIADERKASGDGIDAIAAGIDAGSVSTHPVSDRNRLSPRH
jgi:hypothetical protein